MKKKLIQGLCLSIGALLSQGCFLDLATPYPPGYNENKDLQDLNAYNLFFDPALEHHLTLTMTESEWKGLSTDLEANGKTGNLRKARLKYTGAAGSVELADVGIRTRGNTSRSFPENTGNSNPGNKGIISQAHFQLKFDEPFGMTSGTVDQILRSDRRFFALSTLALKCANGNGNENYAKDESLVREAYAYNFLNSQGVNTSKATVGTVNFVLTDQAGSITRTLYFGPYTMIEPINKSFLTKRFGRNGNDGNLYKCLWQDGGPATLEEPLSYKALGWNDPKILGSENWQTDYHPTYDLNTNQDAPNHQVLKDFVANLNAKSGAALKTYLVNNFEVDRFLRWLAGNVVLGMPDDYWAMGNNYYLYFNNETGRAEVLPYDYDHCLGGGWVPFDTASFNINTWENLNLNFAAANSGHPLVTKILAIPEYKALYHDYLRKFTGLTSHPVTLDAASFQALHDKVKLKLLGAKSAIPGDTWLKGIASNYNWVGSTLSTYDRTLNVNSYITTFMSAKKSAVENQLSSTPAVISLSSGSWINPPGIATGWVNFPIPLGGGSFTASLNSNVMVNSVKWERSTAPAATQGAGATPWIDLGTDNTPGMTFNKVVSIPGDHPEAGVYLRATVTAGSVEIVTQKITLNYQTPLGETVSRVGGNVTLGYKPSWAWALGLTGGRTISAVRAVGDFNSWGSGNPLGNGVVMTYNGGTGLYSGTFAASQGQQYKIWVSYTDTSSDWLSDLTNPLQVLNSFSPQAYNSVIP